MINKFNFYDVYGYFLPGLVFLVLLVLPVGMATGKWPDGGQLVTALLGIPLAYVVGHLLRCVEVFPSTVKDSSGGFRYPSDILLDQDDGKFTNEFKENLVAQIKARFDIDISKGTDKSAKRREVFFLCRSLLIESKTVSYGEQFEGMYALARGLLSAFMLAGAYYFGWALAALEYDAHRVAFVLVCIGGVVALTAFSHQKLAFGSILLALASFGYLLAHGLPTTTTLWKWFPAMTVASIFLARLSHRAFQGFAWEFAKAIYRDFYALDRKPVKSTGENK